jgi:glycosyltransferase involved in cell wall biosynthesis
MYSAVVLTLNEELALPGCLESLAGCDDIVVIDSGSTDSTVAIAKRAGARVYTRPFDSFAGQHNFAQAGIKYQHPWVFHIDADERMTPALDEECRGQVRRNDLDGFRVAPKMMFEGRWIRHCTDYPAYQARFVRAPSFQFVQVGHGQREAPNMRVENLRESYLHDLSIYGREAWINKHRKYACAEAMALAARDEPLRLRSLFANDPVERRRAVKRLSFHLPFRPAVRFFYQYGLRLGFLDGRQGFDYCLLLSRYEGFVASELKRMKGANHGHQA